jgi:hypothetical protein
MRLRLQCFRRSATAKQNSIFKNQFIYLLVSGCSRIRLKLNLIENDNELPCPTLEKNAMSY